MAESSSTVQLGTNNQVSNTNNEQDNRGTSSFATQLSPPTPIDNVEISTPVEPPQRRLFLDKVDENDTEMGDILYDSDGDPAPVWNESEDCHEEGEIPEFIPENEIILNTVEMAPTLTIDQVDKMKVDELKIELGQGASIRLD